MSYFTKSYVILQKSSKAVTVIRTEQIASTLNRYLIVIRYNNYIKFVYNLPW